MKKLASLILIVFIFVSVLPASAQIAEPTPVPKSVEKISVTIPDNTPIDVETMGDMSSSVLVKGSLVSFRVIKPVKIDGKIVIAEDALVTGKVVKAKRGGFWGKAGQIAWEMVDVVAVDDTLIPVNASDEARGVSKEGEAKTKAVVSGALLGVGSLGILAPLGLLYGFKKGKNVTVPHGTRFRVYTNGTSAVTVTSK